MTLYKGPFARAAVVLVVASFTGCSGPPPQQAVASHWSMFGQYCTECHNNADLTAELTLEGRRPDSVHSDPRLWEKVLHKLTIGAMPPNDRRRR